MRVLDLFSGIGGFSLGLERAGMRTQAFCEIDPFCREVLRKHWPEVPIYEDIRSLAATQLAADGICIDTICGGFPCQDVSYAGQRAGIEAARSGLWSEYARLIGELRPKFAIVENTPGLLSLGMGRVIGDLAALGYDAIWDCIPACAVGAPHRRDRIWIVAYPNSQSIRDYGRSESAGAQREMQSKTEQREWFWPNVATGCRSDDVADTDQSRLEGWNGRGLQECSDQRSVRSSGSLSDSDSEQMGRPAESRSQCNQWESEPDVGRVANGVPARVDRLRSLGNAVVPQVVEIIGRAIMKAAQ